MFDADTTMGTSRGAFEATPWTAIAQARSDPAEDRRRGLEHLITRYWKAVYTFIRIRWRYSNEDSKDLTQCFFAWFLESGALDRVQPEYGRFRTYLRSAVTRFLTNEYWSARSIKRGGDERFWSLEAAGGVASQEEGPEEAMDREWRRLLLEQARDHLRNEYHLLGKELHARLFESYYFGRDPECTHERLAASCGLTPTEVNNHLHAARARFRQIVYDLVAETVTDQDGFRVEIRELFGGSAAP